MTATEKLYQIIQVLSEHQVSEVLNFAEFLHQKQLITSQSQPIFPDNLTERRSITKRTDAIQKMRGLLKKEQLAPTDQDVAAMLEERRMEKYF